MAGLRSVATLLNSEELKSKAEQMKNALSELYDSKSGSFYLLIDKMGPLSILNSDPLHALFYLEPGDLPPERIQNIVKTSTTLETSIGYKTFSDPYYNVVWPVEQAFINLGARKFGLEHIEEVSSRIARVLLNSNNEFYSIWTEEYHQEGSKGQLWSMGAGAYFQRIKKLGPDNNEEYAIGK